MQKNRMWVVRQKEDWFTCPENPGHTLYFRKDRQVMITRLQEEHRQQVMQYLSSEPTFTLLIAADIQNYGFESDVFEIWAHSGNCQDIIRSVFCRFYNTLLVYSLKNDIDAGNIYRFLSDNGVEYNIVLGKEELVKQFSPFIAFKEKHETLFAELSKDRFHPAKPAVTTQVFQAREEDALEIHELRESIPEFNNMMLPLEQLIDLIRTKKGRVYFIKENNKIVSSASTGAETEMAAHVNAVCTKEGYRGRGYASQIITRLSGDLLAEGKICCLGYENPVAGRIYNRIGYKELGKLVIAVK